MSVQRTLNLGFVCAIFLLLSCQPKADFSDVGLGENAAIYNPQDLSDFLKNTKISEEQRRTSIEGLRSAFKAYYVGYDLKKDLIGKSGDEIFEQCLNDKFSEPMTTVAFYNNINKCLALFQDSHISMKQTIEATWITTGIASTAWIDGNLYIRQIRPLLLSKFDEINGNPPGTLAGLLKPGAMIVEIDGRPAIEAAKELEPYFTSSSPGYLQDVVSNKLFTRNISYPQSDKVSVKIRLDDNSEFTTSLPWIQFSLSSQDSQADLKDRKIKTADELDPVNYLVGRKGYGLELPLFDNLKEKRTYTDAANEDANQVITTGMIQLKKQNVCYMQISTFDIDKDSSLHGYTIYEKKDETYTQVAFVGTLKEFARSCEAQSLPLIVDVRFNFGGSLELAAETFALFESKETPLFFETFAYPALHKNIGLALAQMGNLDLEKTVIGAELTLKAYQEAEHNQSLLTSWVARRPNRYESSVFTGQALVLTSQNCMSACDLFVHRFKKSGRGLVVGTPTNGTGFGFTFTNGEPTFIDPMGLYKVRIPNTAFQAVVLPKESIFLEDKDAKGLTIAFDPATILENHPSLPDVEVKLTLEDIQSKSAHYIKALLPLLPEPKATPTPTPEPSPSPEPPPSPEPTP